MYDVNRFLKLADSASTPEQKALFMQQHFRLHTRIALDSCRSCRLGGICKCVGFRGKTPAFLSFISYSPLSENQVTILSDLLKIVGYGINDVCLMSLISCDSDGFDGTEENACYENLQRQMALASSRVFVLIGRMTSHLATGTRVNSIRDIRGTWFESRNRAGFKQFMFITEDVDTDFNLMKLDFNALGSLLHYAWATQMQEFFPGAAFEHKMSYEQICDVVANDVKQALMKIPPERRTEEFVNLMTRICSNRDESGMASRAFWDPVMAIKCGIDPKSLGFI